MHFFLHSATVTNRPPTQVRLHVVIKIPNRDTRRSSHQPLWFLLYLQPIPTVTAMQSLETLRGSL